MTGDGLVSLGVADAVRLIRKCELSPVELTLAHLERIEQLEPQINSYITVDADGALERARQAERELVRGETSTGQPLGPLHGVPLAVKDLFDTRGLRTTAGAKFFADRIPEQDAEAVRRVRSAGAVLLGKTNLHEIALGLTTVNPHYGACHNPWALDRVAGGSSGGSAAALAARLCLGALGSDTGGSIRAPAALCGVVGLKPTYGRVSLNGAFPLSWNLDHAGPMARSALDAALLLRVLAGYDPDDPASLDVPGEDYADGIKNGVRGWRVALAEGEYFKKTQPEIAELVQQAAGVFESLGAIVESVDLPGLYDAALANSLVVISDGATVHAERLNEHPEDFGEDIRERLRRGAATPLVDYIRARRLQVQARRQFEQFFERYDLLLLPTTPVTAPPIEGPNALELARLLTRYTAPFNLTGVPALSIPCGFTPDGLPAGLELVGRPWSEAALLRAASVYEHATHWNERFPEL